MSWSSTASITLPATALASGRRLRFSLLQQLLGWCVQQLMLSVALGVIMLAGGVG
jgi:hypothetical protein